MKRITKQQAKALTRSVYNQAVYLEDTFDTGLKQAKAYILDTGSTHWTEFHLTNTGGKVYVRKQGCCFVFASANY